MAEEIVKSSAIMIATGDEVKVYRTLEEVPPDLRRKLNESTSSLNSATVVIANRGGQEKMRQALEALAGNVDGEKPTASQVDKQPFWGWVRIVAGILTGTLIWLILNKFI